MVFQMSLILLVSMGCGRIARMLGQARVIGEIFSGILIGPSVFGRMAPHLFARFFPQTSFAALETLSTIGLILFLFVVGSDLNLEHLQRQKKIALVASLASIVLPFGLAIAFAPLFRARFSPNGVGTIPFSLFLGVSMSITAFPVLARILEERKMQASSLGGTALLCAAVDDVAAWLLLAVAMTFIANQANSPGIYIRFLWLGAYVATMLFVVRPVSRWIGSRRGDERLSHELLGLMLALGLASAAFTDAIGVHPLFGAFLAGTCFPRIPAWQRALRARTESVLSLVLLPLFFALTGLRTRLDQVGDTKAWLWTGFILLLAIIGKMGGAVFGARLTGQGWRSSFALGALLNTRGLVELIVLNIAFDAHVFSPTLFTMLVVMALVTTSITSPILDWLKLPNECEPSIAEDATLRQTT
ncbi:potassium transporter Kef [Acidobacteria bacterium AB60]|nr:potassium transporter Kef [Acidobacteria bacterium AB60]